jgi:fructose-1,6-bisphosphatase/inositol monophosphatase family enzyme
MPVEIEKLSKILRDAAIAEILPHFRRLGKNDIRQKSEAIDLVTKADDAAEQFITARINQEWPEAIVIGEEAASANPKLLEGIADYDLAIIVDPIDGTANYAAGMPLFGVMACVVRRGEVVGGIIYDPMGDDWVMAEKGAGAWLVRTDGHRKRLYVAQSVPLGSMVGTASVGFLPQDIRPAVLANLAKVRIASSFRCAAHEYRTFAAGHWHFTMFNKLLPWDHLAGVLVAQEAGAYVARFDGSVYLPEHNTGGLLLACDQQSWHQLMDNVFRI